MSALSASNVYYAIRTLQKHICDAELRETTSSTRLPSPEANYGDHVRCTFPLPKPRVAEKPATTRHLDVPSLTYLVSNNAEALRGDKIEVYDLLSG
jgi:hypothetical protein